MNTLTRNAAPAPERRRPPVTAIGSQWMLRLDRPNANGNNELYANGTVHEMLDYCRANGGGTVWALQWNGADVTLGQCYIGRNLGRTA